eukprot:5320831-Prymnesium_polylepis.2
MGPRASIPVRRARETKAATDACDSEATKAAATETASRPGAYAPCAGLHLASRQHFPRAGGPPLLASREPNRATDQASVRDCCAASRDPGASVCQIPFCARPRNHPQPMAGKRRLLRA